MPELTQDFAKAEKSFLAAVPDLGAESLAAAGFDPGRIPALDMRRWYVNKDANNCYNFALDHIGNDIAKPGIYAWWPGRSAFMKAFSAATFNEKAFDSFAECTLRGLELDGQKPLGLAPDPAAIAGEEGWLGAVFLATRGDLHAARPAVGFDSHDFHFYALRQMRQGPDTSAFYSSQWQLPQIVIAYKTGLRAVDVCSVRPAEGSPFISTPGAMFRHARDLGYNHFGGFYLMKKPPAPLY